MHFEPGYFTVWGSEEVKVLLVAKYVNVVFVKLFVQRSEFKSC